MPAADVERVFDRFYQGPSVEPAARPSDRNRGAGLGLAIARGLVEAHGGRIWAEANEGPGLAFCFSIPITSALPEGAEDDSHIGAGAGAIQVPKRHGAR